MFGFECKVYERIVELVTGLFLKDMSDFIKTHIKDRLIHTFGKPKASNMHCQSWAIPVLFNTYTKFPFMNVTDWS